MDFPLTLPVRCREHGKRNRERCLSNAHDYCCRRSARQIVAAELNGPRRLDPARRSVTCADRDSLLGAWHRIRKHTPPLGSKSQWDSRDRAAPAKAIGFPMAPRCSCRLQRTPCRPQALRSLTRRIARLRAAVGSPIEHSEESSDVKISTSTIVRWPRSACSILDPAGPTVDIGEPWLARGAPTPFAAGPPPHGSVRQELERTPTDVVRTGFREC